MRVTFVSSYPPSHCGIGEYMRMLAASLKSVSKDVEVVVLSDVQGGEMAWYDGFAGTYVKPTFSRGGGRLEGLLNALSEVGGTDVLHVQHDYSLFGYGEDILNLAVKAKEEGLAKAVVFTMHTVHHPFTDEVEAVVFQGKLNECDAIIVHSHMQEFELRNQGVDAWRIYRIPHGTLLNPYLGYPRMGLLKDLGLSEEDVKGVLAIVPGFLKRDKGLDILLASLKELGVSSEDLTLIVAGEVWDRSVLKYVEGINELVNLLYWERYLSRDEILKLAASADIIILPYRSVKFYSVSGILHLSMGSMKPIVGTRVPKLIELYQNVPRLTVPPDDPSNLAEILSWVIKNYDIVVPYMTSLYGYAVRTQWPRMARRHLSLYLRLLRRVQEGAAG